MGLIVRKPDETFEVLDLDLDVPNPTAGVVYQVRPITKAKKDEFIAAHTRRELNTSTRRLEAIADAKAIFYDTLDYVLVGWSGIAWSDGEALACTRAAKVEQLDEPRQLALVQRATVLQAAREDAAAESFRRAPGVHDLVDG